MQEPSVHGPTTVQGTARERLLSLIRHRHVDTVFQPIVDLQDGGIIGFEALTRPRSGFQHAGELFAAAEREQLLWPLEEVTRAASFQALAQWPAGMRIFCNCTPQVFSDARFSAALVEAVERTSALSPDRIVLEITELCENQHVDGLQEQVERLKSAGFHIAVDDVGVGTSGLSRIMRLRPQWLKLDHGFTQGIDADPFKQNLVRFFVHFARLSNLYVVAEGIETQEQLLTVIGLGVRYGQGYYLGTPVLRPEASDPAYIDAVRRRWSSVEIAAAIASTTTPLRRLCKPARVVQAMTPAASIAAELLRAADPGVIVLDGRRYLGWCSRETIFRDAQSTGGNRPIAAVASNGVCAVAPEATIQECLQVLCLRDEAEVGEPLVVAEGDQILGIVKLRDLLHAAAADTPSSLAARSALTGLPTRARADEHLTALIAAAADSPAREPSSAAAIIDIRCFADFNLAYGYDRGDKLIRELSAVIRTEVTRSDPDIFLAHIGDDRFLILGNLQTLEPRLREFARAFDRNFGTSPRRAAGARTTREEPAYAALRQVVPCPGLSLRILLLPDALRRVRSPRDLYRIEQQLRQRARREEKSHPHAGAIFLTDTRLDQPRSRMSA